MKYRLLSLLLALVMLTGLLTACGSSDETAEETEEEEIKAVEETEDETGDEAEEEEAEAEQSADAEEESGDTETEEPAEAAGEETEEAEAVEETESSAVTYPLTEETETLSLYCVSPNFTGSMAGIEMDWSDFDCFTAVEELTGVHIEFETVSHDYFQSYFNIYIAAGDYTDLIINIANEYTGGLSSAYDQEVIVDLTPYLETCAPDYYALINSSEELHDYAYANEDMVLDFLSTNDSPAMKNGYLIRGDWAEEMGIDAIETLDDLYDYLVAAKTEYGATVPVYMTEGSNEFITAYDLYYSVGSAELYFYAVDGEVRVALNQDDYKEYLTTMQQWYEEGLIYSEFATTTYDPRDNTLAQMIYNGEVAVWSAQLDELDDYAANATDENFISLPIANVTLTGEPTHMLESEYILDSTDICITTACDNVELAVSWMNYWYTEEGIMMYNYGVEGDTWHYDTDGSVVLEDFVVNNEYDADISTFLRAYCPYGNFTGIYLSGRLTDYSSELKLEAVELWTATADGAYMISDAVTLSAEASETMSALSADILTYADTCIPKFILGDMDLETEWDSFVETLESMGLSECIALEQEALDAYNS